MIETIDPAFIRKKMSYPGMVVTDLDGTLLLSDKHAGITNIKALEQLGVKKVIRVIATGRHLRSFFSTVARDFPVDYVIFSSGAGIYDMSSGKVIRAISLDESETGTVTRTLYDLRYDFMLHLPIPDNHKFLYRRFTSANSDFERRIRMYEEYSSELQYPLTEPKKASQALAIRPTPFIESDLDQAQALLRNFTVIRTTSPLDGESLWIEVFPHEVSKGKTCAWLASRLSIGRKNVLAIGNDYNDTDMLEWAGSGVVVDNAKPELLARFKSVPSNDSNGFAKAVEKYSPFSRA